MIVFWIMAVLVVVACIAVIVMYKEAHENNVREHAVQLEGPAQQVRLFFISDTHNRSIDRAMIEGVQSVDAVVIGGDFVDRRTTVETMRANLQLLQTLGPIYFVWGNNDREVGEAKLLVLFEKYGVTVVEDDAVQLPNRPNVTWISAINDTSQRRYSFQDALAKCKDGDVTLFISHNPQVFQQAYPIHKPALMMGGHLHGGQIRLGKLGVHPHGSYSMREGVPTLISNGYGTTLLPLRLMAKPECHVIKVICEEE